MEALSLQVSQELVSTGTALGPLPLINGLFFTGKTCMLYYILILCIIQAQPVVFQDKGESVFLINYEVLRHKGRMMVPGDDILMLVDADGKFCVPKQFLFDSGNLRVLLILSSRSKDD